jgi:hypothetical protein
MKRLLVNSWKSKQIRWELRAAVWHKIQPARWVAGKIHDPDDPHDSYTILLRQAKALEQRTVARVAAQRLESRLDLEIDH